MKKIGIVCASDTELAPFLKRIEETKTVKKAMLTFHEGKIGKTPVTAVYSGVCKVNAAAAVQLLIGWFRADLVINGGTAGGMDPRVGLFDTVVAERCAYHDVAEEILTDFHPWLPSACFPADETLLRAAKNCAENMETPVRFGLIATGEQFIEGRARDRINERLAPLAADMESAAAAHVCYMNQVPFLSVRTVTDTADHSGTENFEKNCERASEISAELISRIIRELEK